MESFKTVMQLGVKHQTALGYGALSLLAAGGEQLFSMVVFRCPCNAWSASYSLVFLLVPALVLLLLGFLLSTRTWRMLTGCCAPAPGVRKRRCRFRLIGLLAASACVAPLTWISVALLHASYYECLATGEQPLAPAWLRERLCQGREATCLQELHLMPCLRNAAAEEVLRYLRAESQVMGWILIATVMSLALICMCITRCRSPVSFLQLKFWKIYLDKEKQMFEIKAKEHAAKLAERNVQSFFESTRPDPFHTPSIREWQQISSVYAFNANGQHYSMIHKYVEAANRHSSIKSAEGDGFPPVLMFVDGDEIGDAAI
ncbi:calcium homeostasis modulator protein 6-like [Ambystoma mexicanum]|uniref:calcium homeostasis modulator protein 6-like n=1 Tax=Ambystoma mexicanum TaxID=8296 RepID=UPI0037E96A5F